MLLGKYSFDLMIQGGLAALFLFIQIETLLLFILQDLVVKSAISLILFSVPLEQSRN